MGGVLRNRCRSFCLDAELSAQSNQLQLQICELVVREIEHPRCASRAVVPFDPILSDDQAELSRLDLVGMCPGSMSRADARSDGSLDFQVNVSQDVLWSRHELYRPYS